jgi:hypothetical protein
VSVPGPDHDEPELARLLAARGVELRTLSFFELEAWPDETVTDLMLDGRPGAITVFVHDDEIGDGLKVVVHAFVQSPPSHRNTGLWVDLDGFHKHRDNSVTPMSEWELGEYY